MPLYEYKCGSCGKTFEVIQKFADEPLKVHPECGGEVVRLFSAPAFHLKGTGWYATDYAKKSNSSDSRETEKAKDSKSDESKADAKKSDSKSNENASPSSAESKPTAPAESKPSAPTTTTT